MKNIFLLSFLLTGIIFSSCENKEKYYGEWSMITPDEPKNHVEKIIITKDSILIVSFPFHKFYSETLKLNKNHLELFATNFDISVLNDSILSFNNSNYIKKGYIPYNDITTKNLISIEYPKIENIGRIRLKNLYYIYFGKKLYSNSYSLQLNDQLSDFKDLMSFMAPSYHEFIYGASLTADKNSKMGEINKIFLKLRELNFRNVALINDKKYFLKDDTIITTYNEGIFICLCDFKEEKTIIKNIPPYILPPPPPDHYSIKNIIQNSKEIIVSLVKNQLFYGLKKIDKNELPGLILNQYQNKYFIILYDDESTYSNYLELMSIYKNTFSKIRNLMAYNKYGKYLDSLSKDKRIEIISSTKKNILTGLSFKDFKKLNIKISEFKLLTQP